METASDLDTAVRVASALPFPLYGSSDVFSSSFVARLLSWQDSFIIYVFPVYGC